MGLDIILIAMKHPFRRFGAEINITLFLLCDSGTESKDFMIKAMSNSWLSVSLYKWPNGYLFVI